MKTNSIRISFLASVAPVLILQSSGVQAQATSPQALSYQGRIVKPNGQALEESGVVFVVQVRSPGAGNCVLYEEQHTVNMAGSDGVFSITLGSGTRSGSTFKDLSTLKQVFDNSSGTLTSLTCASGGSYTPASGDRRKIHINFTDSSGTHTISQDQTVEAAPYALYADSLQGKTPANFIQTVSSLESSTPGSTQLRFNRVINTDYSVLDALLLGNSTLYSKANGSNFNPLSDIDFNSKKITDLADPTSAQDAATKNYCDANLGAKTIDMTGIGSGLGDGKVLSWDAANNKWVASSPSATDATKLPLSGGTMSGAIAMGGNDLTNTGYITQASGRYLGLGAYTDGTEGTLVSGTLTPGGNTYRGVTWYNSTSNTVKYWNGSAVVTLGAAAQLAGKNLAVPAAGEDGKSIRWNQTSGDWEYFTPGAGAGSVTAVTTTAPLAVANGTTTPALSINLGIGVTTVTSNLVVDFAPSTALGVATATGKVVADDHYRLNPATVLGDANKMVRVNATGSGYELRTPAEVRTDLGLGTMATATAADYLTKADNLGSVANVTTARTNLGLGDSATKNVGTANGTVAAGDDSRITGALQKSGGTMSGAIAMGGNDITNAGHIAQGTDRYLGLGAFTDANEGTLVSGTLTPGGNAYKGVTWYNSTSNTVKYWNGSAVVTLGSAAQLAGKNLAVPAAGEDGRSIRWNQTSGNWEYYSPANGSVTNVTASGPLAVANGTTTPALSINLGIGVTTVTSNLVVDFAPSTALGVGTATGKVVADDHYRLNPATVLGDANKMVRVNATGSGYELRTPVEVRTDLGLGTMATATAADYLTKADNLGSLANASTARTNLGLGDSATRNVGTANGTVAAGDDSRITGALQRSGGTMTGALNLPTDGLVVGTTQLVASGGNVGVGTAAPGALFHVAGQARADWFSITNAGSILNNSNNLVLRATNDFEFGNTAATSTYMTIKPTGRVGIGATSPANPLDVRASVADSLVRLQNTSASGWSAIDIFDSGNTKRAYLGWGNSSASPNGNTFYLGTNSNHPILLIADATERMRVTGTGDVGIGTSNPDSRLHVYKSGSKANIAVESPDSTAEISFSGTGGVGFVMSDMGAPANSKHLQFMNTSGVIVFKSFNDNWSQRASIAAFTPAGRVGIGTEGPNEKLDVIGDIKVGTSGNNGCLKNYSGGTITGTCSSDIRLKRDIHPVGEISDSLAKIVPKFYHWRTDEFPERHYGDAEQLGVIAQEVRSALPDLVEEDDEGFLKVKYQDFTMYLLKGFSEQHGRIGRCESDLGDIKRDIASLRTENQKIREENARIGAENQELKKLLQSQQRDLDAIKKMLNIQ